jgi:hypothetical protein
MSRIDVSSTAVGGGIQLYAYEPFNNVFGANTPPDTLRFTNSSSELLGFLRNLDVSTVQFSSTTGFNTGYGFPLSLVIEDLCGTTVMETLSNTVRVGAGRFFPPAQSSTFVFNNNEPIIPQPFVGPISLQNPISSPTLPPGLSFVRTSPNSFNLVGKPIVQSIANTYKIIGRGSNEPSKIVTVDVNMRVDAERLLMDLSGSSNALGLQAGVSIPSATVFSKAPPYPNTGNTIRYTWSPLLEGLNFVDINGIPKSSGFTAIDASSTVTLTGTPTTNSARNAPTGTFGTILNATRLSAPNISNSILFNFAFQEQVLFNTPTIQNQFFTGAAVTSSALSNSFSAFTKFATIDSSITAIWSPDLDNDLSLNFVFNDQRAYLTGTPLSTGSGIFSVYASNANSIVGNTDPIAITIVNDAITFTPPTDTCYNFIVSRDLTNAKPGYYTIPIDFKAVAASGCNFVVSTNDLSGTGLSLSNIGNNTYRVTGIPTSTKPLSSLRVDASSLVTSAIGDTSVNFAIVPDVFTFADTSFTFIENKQITPYQFITTTLSERPVIGYSSSNLPSGLFVSGPGLLTGTPLVETDGSFNIVATTGFVSSTKNYNYTIIPDTMILITNPLSYTYPAGSNVDIQITGLTFSGKNVSNYAFSNFTPSYGVSIGSVSGNITGTLTDSIPPNLVLPSLCNFKITAQAGILDGSLNSTLTTTNPIVNRSLILWYGIPLFGFLSETFIYGADSNISNITGQISGASESGASIELQVKNTSLDNNVYMATLTGGGGRVLRSTTGNSFTSSFIENPISPNFNPRISSLVNKPNTSTWWISGYSATSNIDAVLIKSTDDGLNWDLCNALPIPTVTSRNGNGTIVGTTDSNAYISGIALRYSNGILMAGGLPTSGNTSMARSTDEGSNWTNVATGFAQETAYFSLDDPNVWIATGSDFFKSWDTITSYSSPTDTIKYSTDEGVTWSNVSGGFNVFGLEVYYASNTWVATGITYETGFFGNGYKFEVRYSTDGSNWNVADISSSYIFGSLSGLRPQPPIPLGSLMYDGSNWNVFAYRENPSSPGSFLTEIYSHDNVTSLSSNWTSNVVTGFESYSNVRFTRVTSPVYVRTGTPTLATFSFDSLPPNGPVFTSPTQTSYIFYQFMKLVPITFNAVGTGRVYYLVDSNDLPLGLSFDPIGQTITGSPMRLGNNPIILYAKDDIGVTRLVLDTTTIIPRIIKNQTSAGAYTSLIRQYTEVNAADNARNNRTLPSQNKNLGEFQSPYKSDVISAEPRSI